MSALCAASIPTAYREREALLLPEARMELVSPELLRILRCPVCKGALQQHRDKLCCDPCDKAYPIVLGIPDLRLYEDPLIPLEDDYRKGEKVQVQAERLGFADLVRYYWSLPTYPFTPPELAERFIRHVLTDEARVLGYLDEIGSGKAFLDVGCGTAALVKMAQPKFDFAVGCDVAFRWLLIARRRLQEAGLPANLVCCCADYLPFPDGMFDSVTSVSLLEHVSDARAVVGEAGRVLGDNGRIFVWTTNRFSLAAEPHVRVWGVGFLPRRWMPAYVKWRSGLAYEKKKLLSCFELRRFFHEEGLGNMEYLLPRITDADWNHLQGIERWGARTFSFVGRVPLLRSVLKLVSPVIQVVARRALVPPDSRKPSTETMSLAK
jgi:ubiquinone/menaquinone biosynthesis C-methylase UbiE/uncharacterized protein YbaR (Trm112 family)